MTDRVEWAWGVLRMHGVRRTRQREAVIEALAEAPAGLTLVAVHRAAARREPGIGLRTVERAVPMLQGSGVVEALVVTSSAPRYRLVQPGRHALVCVVCGRVADVPGAGLDRLALGEIRRLGFGAGWLGLTLYSRCESCWEAQSEQRPRSRTS